MKGSENIGNLLRSNKRLARELARLESFFNAINSAIIVIDSAGVITFANNHALEIFSIRDKTFYSVYKIVPEIEKFVASAADGKTISCELEVDYPEPRSLRAQVVPLDYGDADEKIFALIFTDVTQEKLSAAEKIESEKVASVLNLASGVAHELGNPLNSINIHLQLARRKIEKAAGLAREGRGNPAAEKMDEVKDSLKICSDEVSRLDAIIENFLKALRPVRPDLKECDPIKPLVETLKILEAELHNLKIVVNINLEKALPKVYADENLLLQMYFNLLKNSMESMDGGGEISISAKSDDNYVKLKFSDNGCGMDGEDLSKLFTPYFTTKPDGHGLGMMIIEGIVRAHSGKISVESARNQGTSIGIDLPRKSPNVRMLAHTD